MAKTVTARILAVVDSDGKWGALGWKGGQWGDFISCADDLNGGQENHFWITAELVIPDIGKEIKGEATAHMSQVTPEESEGL